MLFVIVGFKLTEKNSVYYATRETLKGMASAMILAFEAGADFVSTRCIK